MKIKQGVMLLLGSLLSLSGCSKVQLLNYTIPRDGYSVTSDIAYGEDARQKLDVYVPDQPAAGHPVIVFFYGGSWQAGSKTDYLFVAQAFASRGYTTVIADYRLYPQVSFPVFLQDNAKALVWAHQHIAAFGGNPQALFLGGHSAGGYNAVMLTVNPTYLKGEGGDVSWIKGTFGLAGAYDFLPMTDPDLIALFGGATDPQTQPITYVHTGLPPMLLLYGDKDKDVLPRNGINMKAKLEAFGDPVTSRVFPGFDHIDIVLALASGFRDKGPVLDMVDAFIRENVQATNTSPNANSLSYPKNSL